MYAMVWLVCISFIALYSFYFIIEVYQELEIHSSVSNVAQCGLMVTLTIH